MDLSREVLLFVSEHLSVPHHELSLETTLFGDLGIDGDDADEFFLAFAKRFNVKLEGLDLSRHFGPEGGVGCFLLMVFLWQVVTGRRDPRDPHVVAGKTPVRVSDLVEAVQCGRWQSSSESRCRIDEAAER